MHDPTIKAISWHVIAVALVATACAAKVPSFDAASAASDSKQAEVTSTTSLPPATTTSAPPPTTTAPPRPSTTTSTTAIPAITATSLVAGTWSLESQARDESGTQFEATVNIPVLTASVDSQLLARVATLIEGRLESETAATLALWRSIEAQGDRDLTGSILTLDFEAAAFNERLVSLRFFSTEFTAGTGSPTREVATLMIDLEAGVEIRLDDIVFDGTSRVILLALVQDRLLTEYFEGDDEAFELWAGNLAQADLERAVITESGIEVWFDELEVGPPAFGTPVVAIPYGELGQVVDPVGPAGILLPPN